jgi:tetratricopeptide (TPR) repeat protein
MSVKTPKKTIFVGLATILLLSVLIPLWAVSEASPSEINPDAFVYILNMGISGNTLKYAGLRNGFAVGDGRYILTAAHCVDDFENTNQVLRQPMVISPYYGDIFEAEIIAVDDVNDIAILRPAWDAHPGLELETSENWKNSESITIAGYPPIDKKRGGNGKNNSQEIKNEEVPLINPKGKANQAITVGPVKHIGEGWSGSAFIVPETGRVAGITCIRKPMTKSLQFLGGLLKIPFAKTNYITGCDVSLIESLFENHSLIYGSPKTSFPDLNRKNQFNQILATLDVFLTVNKQKVEAALVNLCDEQDDLYIVNTLAAPAFGDPNNLFHFENAIAMAPNSSFVHAAYGNYLLNHNKLKKAAEQFQIVTERDPNHIFACHGLLSALVKTDPNAAEALGQDLTQRWPENAGFHFEYSKALRANNKFQAELPVIQKAIELCGENDVPHQYQRYLADSLKANKLYEQAEPAYKKLLKKHECDRCWWAYTTLLLDMGPDKIKQAKKARDKTITFIQDPNQISEKKRFYEAAVEKMISDPNETGCPNH